jgi:diguanylate cyclase (GGDEF)-like protein
VRTVRVVVADSSPAAAELVRVLSAATYQPLGVRDPISLVEAVRDQQPDVVLLDTELVGLEGLEIIRTLKGLRPERFVPLLLLSQRADIPSRVDGLHQGADDYIVKPYAPLEVVARVEALLRIQRQVDEILRVHKELENLSSSDALTGLYSQRYLAKRLGEEFKRAERYNDPLACLLLDLDRFREANERGGHPFGDKVLVEVSGVLRRAVRASDMIFRYGGDEFFVVLPNTHFSGSLAVAERIWRGVGERPFRDGDRLWRGTCSIGISFYPNKDTTTKEHLVRFAEEALQQAKREGGNRICLFQHVSYVYDPARERVGRS